MTRVLTWWRPSKLALTAGCAIALSLAVPLLVAGPAAAVGPTQVINLLNINDFHGRIDDNTVRFAGTIERLRAEQGDANTLLMAAGDNIGASLFASSAQQDQPTIDVLNALDMSASSVGNHEFDQGFADLTDRVIGPGPNARWSYLGANVYLKGTNTPALPEYQVFPVNGVTVGVIGAVTVETPSLVSPGGITTLDFGDPVDAVNRVAAALSDGDPANGEAQVLVAEFHEGAGAGTPDGATFEQEVAQTGTAFSHIVTDVAPSVDVIFTGHTHKQYAWDAPIPGAAGRTRPILQTGSYGEFIGQVKLTVDSATGDVQSYVQQDVPRIPGSTSKDPAVAASENAAIDAGLVAAWPRVAAVQPIVHSALADAAIVGNQPVGRVAADITTAFTGGSYVNGIYAGVGTPTPTSGRDDRSSESALGNLVADSMVESLSDPARGGATIGVVNPGGLRNELLYAPDGVITYAEANAVLPFVNNLWTVSLSGDQFRAMLEQQWQTNLDGTIPSRPYLQLGLSNNVSYTFDSTAAMGSHITSVEVDGRSLDPSASYRIGTFSFLAQGGDNFRIFKDSTDVKDSGLIDRDAWNAYLTNHPGLTPDFARRSVEVLGLKMAPTAGTELALTVNKLDLTSLGAPQNTTISAQLSGADGAPLTAAGGAFPVAGGSATVSVTIPRNAQGAHVMVLTALPSNTTVTIPLLIAAAPAAPEVAPIPAKPQQPMLSNTGVSSATTPLVFTSAGLIVLGALILLMVRRRARGTTARQR